MHLYHFVAIVAMVLLFLVGCGDSNKPTVATNNCDDGKVIKASEPAQKTRDGTTTPSTVAGKRLIDVSYIGRDFFAAAIIHPRRIARLPLVAEQLKEDWISDGIRKFGIDPSEIEQLIVLVPLPEVSKPTGTGYSPTFIIRFAEPVDAKALLVRFQDAIFNAPATEPIDAQIAGKACLRLSAAPWCVAYAPSPTTMVLGVDHYLEDILRQGEPKGPLVELLKKADVDHDVVVAASFENFPRLDKLFENDKRGASMAAQTYLDAITMLHDGVAFLSLEDQALLHADFDTKGAAGADSIENSLTQLLKLQLSELAALRESMSSQQRSLAAPLLKIWGELLSGATVTKSGARVTVEIKQPPSMQAAVREQLAMSKPFIVAARRSQVMKNLRAIAIAILAHVEAKGIFPPAIIEKDSKPLLSWRVAILPYIGEQELYNAFHLNEAWDSPHNMQVAKRMPRVYQSSAGSNDGKTVILALTGNRSAFDGGRRIGIADLPKGASDTLMVVEAGPDKAVFWTKPEDVPLEPGMPPAAVIGNFPDDGFQAAFCNGTVVRIGVDKARLKAFRKPSGGESVR